MSSFLTRVGTFVGVAALCLASTALAQVPKPAEPEGVNVFNPVEGRITVASCKPEGAVVKKGDVVCELDPTPLKDRLSNQEIVIQAAKADLENAKLTREVAEIAINEYKEGIQHQDMQTVEGEIALTRSDRERAQDRLVWAKRMHEKGFLSANQLKSEELSLQKSIFGLEQAQTKKQVLQKFIAGKTLKQLFSEVEKAKAAELAKTAALDREQTVQKSLEKQIAACRVVAPADGRVRYNRPFGERAVVRDGDRLFQVVRE